MHFLYLAKDTSTLFLEKDLKNGFSLGNSLKFIAKDLNPEVGCTHFNTDIKKRDEFCLMVKRKFLSPLCNYKDQNT